MATYTRPAWVAPGAQWSSGQTYEQYATTGQPVATGYQAGTPATPTTPTGWQPPAGTTYIPSMDVMGQYTNVVQKPSSPDFYGVLTADSLKPQEPIQISQLQQDSSIADAIAAGTASYADYLKLFTAPKTETSTQYDTLMQELTSLLPEAGGRGAAQLAAEQQYGVTDLNKQLADINAQMLTKIAEYDVLEQKTKQRQTTTDVIYGEIVHQKNQLGSEMGLLQARALGLQGQYNAAVSAANRAVDLKYSDIEDQINIRMNQLKLLEGKMNKEEQQRASALEAYLNDQKTKIADQKSQQKESLNFALANNITKPYYKVGDQIYRTLDGHLFGNMEEATKAGVLSDLSNVQTIKPASAIKWSEPYSLGGDLVQKNLSTGEIRTAVNVAGGSTAGTWSEPYTLGENYVQRNSKTGEIRTAGKIDDKQSERDAEFEKYARDLAMRTISGDMTREQARDLIKTSYSDYDENVIYDLVRDQ